MKVNAKGDFQCYECPAVFRSRSALSRHKAERHGANKTRFRCPYCKHEGTRALDVFHRHIQRIHPDHYDSTTMKSIEAVIRPAVEPVRRPTHTDTLATSHVGITEIDNFDSPGKRSLVATLSPAVRVMPVLEYRGTPIYVPTALKRSLERSEEVSPYVPKRLRLNEEIGPKPGVSIGEERRPSSVICTPPPRKVECDWTPKKKTPYPAATQTGSVGTECSTSETQTSPSIQRQEISEGTIMDDMPNIAQPRRMSEPELRHTHTRRTTVFPDGRREVVEETKWYIFKDKYSCCGVRCSAGGGGG